VHTVKACRLSTTCDKIDKTSLWKSATLTVSCLSCALLCCHTCHSLSWALHNPRRRVRQLSAGLVLQSSCNLFCSSCCTLLLACKPSQASRLLGLKHFALKVGAHAKVSLSVAGCPIQVSSFAYSIQSFSVQLIVFHDILWSLFLLAVHLNWLCMLVSLLGSKLNSILVGAPRGSMLLKL